VNSGDICEHWCSTGCCSSTSSRSSAATRSRARVSRLRSDHRFGLLPTASAVVVTLFGALSNDIHGSRSARLFGFALAAFVAMGLVGTMAVFPPRLYRKSRKDALQKLPDGGRGLDQEPTVEWLSSMIDLERKLTSRLETALGEERGALLLVQGLFVAQIVLLGWITLSSAWMLAGNRRAPIAPSLSNGNLPRPRARRAAGVSYSGSRRPSRWMPLHVAPATVPRSPAAAPLHPWRPRPLRSAPTPPRPPPR
jgi:hypothetical protein